LSMLDISRAVQIGMSRAAVENWYTGNRKSATELGIDGGTPVLLDTDVALVIMVVN